MTQERTTPIHTYMQRSINVGLAARVINMALDGEDVKPQRLATAIEVYRKTVPNFQAIAIEIEHKVSNNILDLQAKALEAGLDPSTLLPEKVASHEQSQLDPPTPGCDSGD